MIRGGVPALVDETGWWRVDDVWFWALEALVVYVRAAEDRAYTKAQHYKIEFALRLQRHSRSRPLCADRPPARHRAQPPLISATQ